MKKNRHFIINFFSYALMITIILVGSFYIYKVLIKNDRIINGDTEHDNYKVNFVANGSSLGIKNMECNYVTENDCYVVMPDATRDNGYVLGYGLKANDKDPLYKIGDKVKLTDNITLFVISYQELKLTIGGTVDYLSSSTNNCIIYNTDNSCNVTIPYFNKLGYEIRGYSTNQKSLTGFIYPGTNYEISKDTTIYPIYNTLSRYKTLDVIKTYNIGNMIIEVEKNCIYDNYKIYLDYFSNIKEKASYLVIGNKISFLTDDTFDDIWGKGYVGMNYGPRDARLIDVRCSNSLTNNYYATIIHEMAHTWDFYYNTKFGSDITEQNDIIGLYNKYKNSNNQPFRSYSYSSIKEFFADMVRYYYLKYIDPDSYYKSLLYPDDIKLVLEKYICIANNNYKENKCN